MICMKRMGLGGQAQGGREAREAGARGVLAPPVRGWLGSGKSPDLLQQRRWEQVGCEVPFVVACRGCTVYTCTPGLGGLEGKCVWLFLIV